MFQTCVYNLANSLIDFFFPAQCLRCRQPNQTANQLCFNCWQKLNFVTSPCCSVCGWPLPFETSSAQCLTCLSKPPSFHRGQSIFLYDGVIRELILRFKHNDATYLAPLFGKWLTTYAKPLLEYCDLVIPVPLHRWRLAKRQYNQTTQLARQIKKLLDKPYLVNCLIRHRSTTPQSYKSRNQRLINVQNAFYIPESKKPLLYNKKVLLLDDVWTTGATLDSCCKTLYQANVKEISVLTLARVVNIS